MRRLARLSATRRGLVVSNIDYYSIAIDDAARRLAAAIARRDSAMASYRPARTDVELRLERKGRTLLVKRQS